MSNELGPRSHKSSCVHDVQALAQDQLRALRHMCAAAFGDDAPHVEVYDGDTVRVKDTCIPATVCSSCFYHVQGNTEKSVCCVEAWQLDNVHVAVVLK